MKKQIIVRLTFHNRQFTDLTDKLYNYTIAWATKSKLDIEKVLANLSLLRKYSLQTIAIDFKLMESAAKFAKNYQISSYDATYAVLAKQKKCQLVTADKKFLKLVNLPYIKHLSTWI